jgi:hypothetical protein
MSFGQFVAKRSSLTRVWNNPWLVAGTDRETANIIFFKITSADSRNKIIEKLLRKKCKDDYNLFRNSLLKHLRPIDIERNEVVHCNVVNHVGADDEGETTSILL